MSGLGQRLWAWVKDELLHPGSVDAMRDVGREVKGIGPGVRQGWPRYVARLERDQEDLRRRLDERDTTELRRLGLQVRQVVNSTVSWVTGHDETPPLL